MKAERRVDYTCVSLQPVSVIPGCPDIVLFFTALAAFFRRLCFSQLIQTTLVSERRRPRNNHPHAASATAHCARSPPQSRLYF